jgi:acyl-CoA thioester hydrolase
MGWIETQRSAVESWDADYLGHIELHVHVARFSEAAMNASAALGLTPDVMRNERRGISTVRQRIRFMSELRPGDFLHVESGVAQIGTKSLMQAHRMTDSATGKVAATMEQTVVLLDLDARRGLAWPEPMRERARAMQVEWRNEPPSFPPIPTGTDGFRDTYRGAAMPWEMDVMGHLSVQFYVARFSAAAGHALLNVGLTREVMDANSWGLAALDYVVTYARECKAGDCLAIKTGITEVGSKTLKLCHKMVDAVTGEPIATLEVVSLLFNSTARRGEPLPADMRAKAEALLVR